MSYTIGDYSQNERCTACAAPLTWRVDEEPAPGADMVHMVADCGCGQLYETWAPVSWRRYPSLEATLSAELEERGYTAFWGDVPPAG